MGMSIFSHLYWASSFSVIFFCCVTSEVGRSRGLHQQTANNGVDVFWQLRTKSALHGSFWRKGNCLKWGNIQDHKPISSILHMEGQKALLNSLCLMCWITKAEERSSGDFSPKQWDAWFGFVCPKSLPFHSQENATWTCPTKRGQRKNLPVQLVPSAWGSRGHQSPWTQLLRGVLNEWGKRQ